MSLRQTLKVGLEDGSEHVLQIDGRDYRAWEAWRGESIFGGSTTYSRLCEFAYLSGARQGLWNGEYESWEPTCVDVSLVRQEAVDPTQTARSDEPSSPSQSEPESAPSSGKSRAKKPS